MPFDEQNDRVLKAWAVHEMFGYAIHQYKGPKGWGEPKLAFERFYEDLHSGELRNAKVGRLSWEEVLHLKDNIQEIHDVMDAAKSGGQ